MLVKKLKVSMQKLVLRYLVENSVYYEHRMI